MKKLICLSFVVLICFGCTLQRPVVFFEPTEKIKTTSSMAIAMNEDPANVRMDLQTALLKDGYSIVSTAGNENAENILNFSYNYYYDDAGNVFLNGFWVEITKRQTGTVIMSISYPSGNFKKTLIIRNFLKRFNLCVKENICDEKGQEKNISQLDKVIGSN